MTEPTSTNPAPDRTPPADPPAPLGPPATAGEAADRAAALTSDRVDAQDGVEPSEPAAVTPVTRPPRAVRRAARQR